jgi:FdhE protein
LSPMTVSKKADWDARLDRAIDLAAQHPAAAQVLAFYSRILEFQKTLYNRLTAHPSPASDAPFRQRLDVDSAAQHFPELLALVQQHGPSKLAQEAADFSRASSRQHRLALNTFLEVGDAGGPEPYSFFARVLFQPQAEHQAAAFPAPPPGSAGSLCPVCSAKPQVAVLRPEGDGGKRFLVCSFCSNEWEFRRILCPLCGEMDYQKLPRYSTQTPAAMRVEACDSCHSYLKSVDMTIDGHAVPLVDEVATAPLDVWAIDHGYQKISLNLMGF